MESTAQHEKDVEIKPQRQNKEKALCSKYRVCSTQWLRDIHHLPGKIIEWLLHLHVENGTRCQLAKTYEILRSLCWLGMCLIEYEKGASPCSASLAERKHVGSLGINTGHNSTRKTKPDLRRDKEEGHRLQDQWRNQVCYAEQRCVGTVPQKVSQIQPWQTQRMMMMMI